MEIIGVKTLKMCSSLFYVLCNDFKIKKRVVARRMVVQVIQYKRVGSKDNGRR